MPAPLSRRQVLRHGAGLALLGSAASTALNLTALGSAAAQTAGDYRALVCVFLFGGNDAYNTVLPTDTASWATYQAVRSPGPDPIALRPVGSAPVASAAAGSPARLGGVLPLTPRSDLGRGVALHPLLGGVRDLFEADRVAIVANVGPLVRPTRKADYQNRDFPRPASLFSHNDQTAAWQALAAEGSTTGWGGRLADLLMSSNQHGLFSAISANGNAVWLTGRQVLQYQVGTGGAVRVGGSSDWLFGSSGSLAAARAVMREARTPELLARDHAAVAGRSLDAESLVGSSLPSAVLAPYGTPGLAAGAVDPLLQYDHPLTGVRTINPLAQQLQVVARMIGGRTGLGARRQVFFVGLGGFDTHDQQNRQHADLMARLSHGLTYFDAVLGGIGLRDQVTTFTASEFGRTFTTNGDGTDHGWGAHHLVMGGAVRGRDVYGRLPQFGTADGRGDFTSPDQIANGSLVPGLAVDQLGATLGRWFGVSEASLLDVFPNLANFDAGTRDLGFMRG